MGPSKRKARMIPPAIVRLCLVMSRWAKDGNFPTKQRANGNCLGVEHQSERLDGTFAVWQIWVFPKIEVPENGWFIRGKTLLKWMIWGYHYFWKHPYGNILLIFHDPLLCQSRCLKFEFCKDGSRKREEEKKREREGGRNNGQKGSS